ncbi:restriction endonuclease subunit S [Myroides marinus]|uniref:restriction endonuclease subunit S n=1 Tax=Myroides marinus TaxID=703342 RepID=UPI0025782070|nr:restriction endonuclease subunit S [Myroides marinus]MDM1354655.1 restriction endonuclease subunit S [Myroides marinus]MDM1366136.1 restriction endonuclease subunit S [Myroides marinus]MDM1533686.1 restriction endonuclease subunit S [Myroides marinus]MDM1540650.1 restriction endonuclease subunit S [Myroides marinus]
MVREGYKQTELGVIPEEWKVKKLGDLGDVKMCKRIFQSDTTDYGDIPFFKIGTFGKEPDAFISRNKYEEFKSKFSFPNKGEILISAAGTIGRLVKYNGEESYFQDSNIVWINNTKEIVSNELLVFILENIRYNTEGGTIQRLYNNILKSTIFICPPLEEQEAIATALSDTDKWISSLEELIAKKRLIKQGAMQELLTPKEDWEVKTLGSFTKVFTKQTGFDYSAYIKPSLVKRRGEGDIPFIQNKDFNNKWINYETDYFIPKKVAFNFPNILLNEKSLLISISGAIGNIGIYESTNVAFIGGAIAILKFKDIRVIDWIMYYLKSDLGQLKLFGNVKAGSHQNLILDDLRKLHIPFPELQEQERITTILSDMDKEIEQLDVQLEKAKDIKQGMMQELLTGRVRLV